MDSKQKFCLGVWIVIAIAFLGGTTCGAVAYSYNNKVYLDALSRSPNPQAFACANLTNSQQTYSERYVLLAEHAK